MSVMIKDMKMPETCEDCPLSYDEMSCAVTGTRWRSDTMVLLDFDYQKERLHDCPLSEVSSVQPETCEDAVSRKAVEEMLKNEFPARGMWEIEGDVVKETVCEMLIDALMGLEKLPSVTPKRKTGRWLIREGISDAQCSECKMYFRDVYDMDNSDAFCRCCGAKMEGLKVVKNE